MKCPKCGSEYMYVTDSRQVDNLIRRRRKCEQCGHSITTYEADVNEQIRPTSRYMKRALKRAVNILLDDIAEGGEMK